MKKIFLLLSIMLTAICSASALNAEDVVGKWISNDIKIDPTPEMPLAMTEKIAVTFNADNSAEETSEVKMSLPLDDKIYVDIYMKVDTKGTYKCEGDSIIYEVIPGTVSIKFEEDDIQVHGIDDDNMVSQITSELYNQFNSMLEPMKEEFANATTLNNVMVTGKKMICTVDGIMTTFKRKK